MATKKKYTVLIIILLIGIVGAGFVWLRSYVFSNLTVAINRKVESLKLSGFNVHYDSLSVDWKRNLIDIYGVLLEKNAYDTACIYPEFISVAKVRAEGIRLFPLLLNNVLDFEDLFLDSARVVMRENSLFELDSAAKRENQFTLKTDRVIIHAADLQYTDSLRCEVIAALQSNFRLEGLQMEFRIDEPFAYSVEKLTLEDTEVNLPLSFYTLEIKSATMNFLNETLAVDSTAIIPQFGKLEFGRQRGYEVDRFEGMIPYIKASNFSFSFLDSMRVTARMAEIRLILKIFRDKRLPFRKVPKYLPVDMVRSLPFGLAIDSLKVVKSYIQYEEFPEEASEAGGVFFDNLYAMLSNINNGNINGHSHLRAEASLMGQGNIAVSVAFPLARHKRSSISGSLQNFSLPKINPMLTPSTNIKVESGTMKKLTFNFWFNAVRSDGEIELNYEDLKLISYKEEEKDNGELQKDNLKTFMMNTFVFRKNMDEDVPEEKRMGTIMYMRDNNRSIFNFWVKSVLSGVKSAYNLDKATEKKAEREDRKEQRQSKRLAKKLKKAEKKKERG